MRFTVLGATGFIGRHLVMYLQSEGHEVLTPARDAETLAPLGPLGHVIYAIGLTGGRPEPAAMIEAHVTKLQRLMYEADFSSWLYLSSTRPYGALPADAIATEDTPIPMTPGAYGIFDISKLLSEAICLADPRPTVRVARMSNVYGADQSPHTFLSSIMRDIAATGRVTIGESSASGKDYIAIDDAVRLLAQIAVKGQQRLYNVARGETTTHTEIAEIFEGLGKKINFADGGVTRLFPQISIERLAAEFPPPVRRLVEDLPMIFYAFCAEQKRMAS